MTSIAITILLLAPAGDPQPLPLISPTRDGLKEELEQHKTAKPRLPLPPESDGPASRVNNGRFRNYYIPANLRDAGGSREPEPAMTLDNTFKVKLFWIVSRSNDCRY